MRLYAFSTIGTILGLFLIFTLFINNKPSQPIIVDIPQQSTEVIKTPGLITGTPSRLVIPESDIDIPVLPGDFNADDSSWTLSGNAAHFASPTIAPNNISGNTFIYGHNNRQVFAGLIGLEESELAYVHTEEGRTFTYKMSHRQTVSPTDLSLFEYEGPSMLTLQTCSGLWYQDRDLLWFEFIEVTSAKTSASREVI